MWGLGSKVLVWRLTSMLFVEWGCCLPHWTLEKRGPTRIYFSKPACRFLAWRGCHPQDQWAGFIFSSHFLFPPGIHVVGWEQRQQFVQVMDVMSWFCVYILWCSKTWVWFGDPPESIQTSMEWCWTQLPWEKLTWVLSEINIMHPSHGTFRIYWWQVKSGQWLILTF